MPTMATLVGVVGVVVAARVVEAQRILATDLEVVVDYGHADLPSILRAPLPR